MFRELVTFSNFSPYGDYDMITERTPVEADEILEILTKHGNQSQNKIKFIHAGKTETDYLLDENLNGFETKNGDFVLYETENSFHGLDFYLEAYGLEEETDMTYKVETYTGEDVVGTDFATYDEAIDFIDELFIDLEPMVVLPLEDVPENCIHAIKGFSYDDPFYIILTFEEVNT